jgi:hypothetical protein
VRNVHFQQTRVAGDGSRSRGALAGQGRREHPVEFKSNVPDKDETLKKLSSFANTFGGTMIVGAKANSADGRLQDLPGVDEQPGYRQKVIQWCFDGTSPPLIVAVSDAIPAPGGNGKFCYVVQADESDVAPHFVNGRKGVWVRSDEFSQRYEPELATENEIRHLLDRRRLVNERRSELLARSQRRFETMLARRAEEGGDKPPKSTVGPLPPRVEICFGPRFPARPVCGHEELGKIMQDLHVGWRQTGFPYGSSRCISQHESTLRITPEDARNRKGMIEANIWGLVYYGTELEIEIGCTIASWNTYCIGWVPGPLAGVTAARLVSIHAVSMARPCLPTQTVSPF